MGQGQFRHYFAWAAAAVTLVTASNVHAAETAAPLLSITLRPAASDAAGAVPFVDLTISASGMEAKAGERLFRLPVVANTVVTSAKDIERLAASDDAGAIPTTTADEKQDDSNVYRFWHAGRPVNGTVTIRYRVPIDAALPPFALPQYELRTEGATFSGSATSFVALPADGKDRRVRVSWDLSSMPQGAIGVSSFGIGNVETKAAYSSDRLGSVYYMGGRPGVFRSPTGGFFGAWQGKPSFSAPELMQWAAKLHSFYGRFFDIKPASFGVFGRTNPLNPGSGIGLTDSFAFTFNHSSTMADLRSLLAHEMLHSWVRSFDESMDAPNGLAASWFGEGLAVHYQRLLPYRAGLITAEEFLDDLNSTAGRYYTNAKINVPNAAIPAGFWRDTRVRVLPYDRGSLYFAKVDADIRKASKGQRSLDDIVRSMLATRQKGQRMDLALWIRLLRAELGEAGARDFEDMLAGKVVLPPSDAFGACFVRTTRPLRRFDLGFDPATLTQKPKIVRGLVPGSNAAQAGLRDGDEILNSFPQDGLQADQSAYLDLQVRRGDEKLTIRYQPRGETVQAYQWVLDPSRGTTPGC